MVVWDPSAGLSIATYKGVDEEGSVRCPSSDLGEKRQLYSRSPPPEPHHEHHSLFYVCACVRICGIFQTATATIMAASWQAIALYTGPTYRFVSEVRPPSCGGMEPVSWFEDRSLRECGPRWLSIMSVTRSAPEEGAVFPQPSTRIAS